MILYDDTHPTSLLEFGIQIPISDSRTANTFHHLSALPALGGGTRPWLLPRVTETIGREDLLRCHDAAYVDRLHDSRLEAEIVRTYELVDDQGRYHRYDPDRAALPLTRLFDRVCARVAGTAQCCRVALDTGFCFYFGGGMHHAHPGFGHGFCLLNDIVIAIRKLRAEGRIRRAWVIDVDAHKGDGTAAMTREDPDTVALSIHMARGWPLDGPETLPDGTPNPSFLPSDVDIPVAPGEEAVYLERLAEGLQAIERTGRPDLAVVVGGADPYEKDVLPSTAPLRLSLPQLLERDLMVYRFLTARGIPYAGLMAGGYGDHAWEVYAQFLGRILPERFGAPVGP
jgi:acetoin utilization deacetylase AcuC-like enzyme